MKNSKGVFLNNSLYLGGGYTGNCKLDAVVYAYDSTSEQWSSLPPCPLKWSSLSLHNGRLLLVGGRAVGGSKPRPSEYTNKIAVWDEENRTWCSSVPSMIIPRLSPVVISHEGYLIVAGGKKGSLDYNAEVLDKESKRWHHGPPLPLPCLKHTNTVIGGQWYLLNQSSGEVIQTNIDTYIAQALQISKDERNHTERNLPHHNTWTKLTHPPTTPFKISCTNSHLLGFCETERGIDLYIHKHNSWEQITGKFPSTLSTGFILSNTHDQDLIMLGGDTNEGYSTTVYKLSIMTCKELTDIKKKRRVRISV